MKKSYYLFYLNLIGKNRKVYSKTDCLFIDFINAFPIFKEMLKENFTSSLFNRMARNIKRILSKINKCQSIIPVNILILLLMGISWKNIWLYF